jgi:hypothetical protein
LRALLRCARLFVTRVAAVLLEEEDLVPRFFGEIFFAAIRFTPFDSRPVGLRTWAQSPPRGPGRL